MEPIWYNVFNSICNTIIYNRIVSWFWKINENIRLHEETK
jgi:hypothetical protein